MCPFYLSHLNLFASYPTHLAGTAAQSFLLFHRPFSHPSMEDANAQTPAWAQRMHTLAHILTHPTAAPSLHSQLFVAAQVPCFLSWDYPPFLCRPASSASVPPLLRWSLALFLRRAARLGLPASSWRSKCPFQQPPPLVLSSAVDLPPRRLGPEERRECARKRLRRGRIGIRIPDVLAFAVPNLALLSLLLWDPLWLRRKP